MSLLRVLESAAKGTVIGIAVVTALPIAGPVGTITAAGRIGASVLGGICGVLDALEEESE